MLKNHNSSKKSFSVFMLFSMVVCCVASIISCFDNSCPALQKADFSKTSIGDYSVLTKKNLAFTEFDKFSCGVESDSPAEFSCRNYKRNSYSNTNKTQPFFGLTKFEGNEISLFSIELKRVENNNKNIITENIGITERFQV